MKLTTKCQGCGFTLDDHRAEDLTCPRRGADGQIQIKNDKVVYKHRGKGSFVAVDEGPGVSAGQLMMFDDV